MIDLQLILHVLITFGALQAIFLSFIFFTRKKGSLPDKFLALFLTIEGVTLIERMLAETQLIESFPHLLGISYPINFIKPPILFLLTLAIIYPKFLLKPKHLLHAIPFLMMLLMNMPFYAMSGTDKLAYVARFITYIPTYDSLDFWMFISFYLYIGIYLWLSISALKSFKKHIKNNRHANWYYSVLRLYLLGLALGFAYFLVRPSGFIDIPMFSLISMLVMTFLIQSIAYNFITQNNLFNSETSPTLDDVDQRKKDVDRIRNKLEVEKAFLDDALTLSTFSESLDLSKKYVSDLVNQHLGYTFREAINYYRVEEAKQLMKDEGFQAQGLIQIGMASGFNNKVSFYRTFKRFTGKSPSEYTESVFSASKK